MIYKPFVFAKNFFSSTQSFYFFLICVYGYIIFFIGLVSFYYFYYFYSFISFKDFLDRIYLLILFELISRDPLLEEV